MKIKICGLTTPQTVTAALDAGADFIGFVFYEDSPRNIDAAAARYLRGYIPPWASAVALLVDPKDSEIDSMMRLVAPGMIQLHGDETPERVAAIRARSKIPVMKALRIGEAAHLDAVKDYEPVCDWLLFDARSEEAALPGGTGRSFDWTLLRRAQFKRPWMLSGGLHPGNVADALAVLKPDGLDVSSGVETAPGRKDPAKIAAFIDAARGKT